MTNRRNTIQKDLVKNAVYEMKRHRPWAGPVFPREAVGTEKSVFSGEKPGKYG